MAHVGDFDEKEIGAVLRRHSCVERGVAYCSADAIAGIENLLGGDTADVVV